MYYFVNYFLEIAKSEADNLTDQAEPIKSESSTIVASTSNGEPSTSNCELSSFNDNDALQQPSTSAGIVKEESDTASAEPAVEEEASNVEIAWEVLNLAKDIFYEQDTKESKINLAETLLKLGEIAMDWENFVQAVAFLSESLDLRKEVLSPNDRLISEVYYSLGLAFQLNNELDKASACFENSYDIIKMRLEDLQKKNIDSLSQFDKDSHAKEIRQLEGILPDIQVKIDDLKEQMASIFQTKQALLVNKAELEAAAEKAQEQKLSAAGSSKPATDISHLIKRKVCLLFMFCLHL